MAEPQQPQDVVPQQGQPPLVAPSTAPIANTTGETLQCQWQNCGERCVTPDALYEHVCERHVGRKSTNNLNLTCQWGSCRTTTVKRDHITSHIRVHVPLKPHKCDFCGKSFKRPQDLKKHVKTHAEDTVALHGNDANGAARQQGGGHNGHAMNVNANYYAHAQGMAPGQGYDPSHQAAQYYHPQQTGQAGQHPGYGPVTYYNAPATQASLNDYESRKRGFEGLNHFFGQLKSGQVHSGNYQNISNRLYELQGLQLPMVTQQPVTAIPAYQPVSALAGGDDAYGQGNPMQVYSLPPMGNAKTRGDLTSIDQILEQMQATIYETQPAAHYVAYQTSQSPPSVPLQNLHAQQSMLDPQSTTESVHSTTPALTPPSSAQSYTSGHSPISNHAQTPLQGITSAAVYPTLPSGSNMDYGTPGSTNAATLSGMYDGEEHRRRFGGGMLQRAAPGKRATKSGEEGMEISSEGSATPPTTRTKGKGKQKKQTPKTNVIDPALGGETSETPASEKGGELSPEEAERQRMWVENMRLIEWMRDYVRKRLEKGEFEEDEAVGQNGTDTDMGGMDEKKAEGLYPILKAIEGTV